MISNVEITRIVFILCLLIAPVRAFAQGGAPVQVNVRVPAKANGLGAFFERRIVPGEATVSGRVRNLPGDDTTLVTLQFAYKTDADFALDEIISRIVIAIEDSAGNEFSRVTIVPDTVNLNPNRVPLYYSTTLYTPPETDPHARYTVHVLVFGNYE